MLMLKHWTSKILSSGISFAVCTLVWPICFFVLVEIGFLFWVTISKCLNYKFIFRTLLQEEGAKITFFSLRFIWFFFIALQFYNIFIGSIRFLLYKHKFYQTKANLVNNYLAWKKWVIKMLTEQVKILLI